MSAPSLPLLFCCDHLLTAHLIPGDSGANSPPAAVVGPGRKTPAESDDEYGPDGHAGDDTESNQQDGDAAWLPDSSSQQSYPSAPVEGMLPRDMPNHTPFFDPVAERQMTQTDAKLFYQTCQSQFFQQHQTAATSPHVSPMISAQLPPPLQPPTFLRDMTPVGASRLAPGSSPALQASSNLADSNPHLTQEFATICHNIRKVVDFRRKYLSLSLQREGDNPKDDPNWLVYPPPPDPAWRPDQDAAGGSSLCNSMTNSMVLNSEARQQSPAEGFISPSLSPPAKPSKKRKPGHDIGADFEMENVHIPGPDRRTFKLDEMGVYQVFENVNAQTHHKPIVAVPTLKEFYISLDFISAIASDGPGKSFAFRRLQYLESRFGLYRIQSSYKEIADSKQVPHRDFYNVRKVDTHVHHSACMNQKHLLRFIKSKLKKHPHEKVIIRDGKLLSLTEVFESIKLTAYDLSIDTLDMHVSHDP